MKQSGDHGQPWLERFLLNLGRQRNYSHRTLVAYRHDIERFIVFFGEDPASASAQDISRFTVHLKRQGLRNSSISRRLSAVRSFYNFLLAEGQVTMNPAAVKALHNGDTPLSMLVGDVAQPLPAQLPRGVAVRELLPHHGRGQAHPRERRVARALRRLALQHDLEVGRLVEPRLARLERGGHAVAREADEAQRVLLRAREEQRHSHGRRSKEKKRAIKARKLDHWCFFLLGI